MATLRPGTSGLERLVVTVLVSIAAATAFLFSASVYSAEPNGNALRHFEEKIRPVLVARCYECHSADAKEIKGGLRLDTRETIRKGGDSGPAVVPGDPDASLLLKAIRYDELQMPPSGKLPPEIVRSFETWIRNGAADPREAASSATQSATDAARPESGANPSGLSSATGVDLIEGRRHWAFQPPRPQDLPSVKRTAWAAGRLDRFVLKRLDDAGLSPNVAAERRTLLRRVSFDLVGLPPEPNDIESFSADSSPDAYERVVDRLLASPRYGERWARPWLDVARYGEDQAHIVGDDRSLCYPNAYLYRDWVIRAFNADLPYDRFVELQLAADLIEPDSTTNLPALGFLGLGPKYYDRGKLAVMAEEWDDRVDVVTRGLLGLTVACARCHDHKFDPIKTEDYYALAGVFAGTEMFNRPLVDEPSANEKSADGKQPSEKRRIPAKKPDEAMHIVREGKPTDLAVFIRGNVESKGPIVERRFLPVLCPGEPPRFTQGSGRRELASAIVRRDNPLAARVIVNRQWAACFGQPLVATPSNFGLLGARPTHRELLDDVAVRFVEGGWSLKSLQREFVTSLTYRQSSHSDPARTAADPENRLLARMNRRRLSVEAWRDELLSASGNLDSRIGGPSIDPLDAVHTRRTVYSAVSRLDLNRMLAMFDFPDANLHSDRRAETTTPLQKLFVSNSAYMVQQAEAFARRLAAEVPESVDQYERRRIERAYQVLFARDANEDEIKLGLAYLAAGQLAATTAQTSQTSAARWPRYAHVLLATSELMFVD